MSDDTTFCENCQDNGEVRVDRIDAAAHYAKCPDCPRCKICGMRAAGARYGARPCNIGGDWGWACDSKHAAIIIAGSIRGDASAIIEAGNILLDMEREAVAGKPRNPRDVLLVAQATVMLARDVASDAADRTSAPRPAVSDECRSVVTEGGAS